MPFKIFIQREEDRRHPRSRVLSRRAEAETEGYEIIDLRQAQ